MTRSVLIARATTFTKTKPDSGEKKGMAETWWVTARYEPSALLRKPVFDARGHFLRYDETETNLKVVEFHWCVLAESSDEAAEIIRTRGYFFGNLDAKFDCRVGRVAVLGLERPTDILSEQEQCAAMAVGDGCGEALTVPGIVMLAKRLREFVFQA